MRSWILGLFAAILVHGIILLFGGLLFPKHEAETAKVIREVDLLTDDSKQDEKQDEEKKDQEKKEQEQQNQQQAQSSGEQKDKEEQNGEAAQPLKTHAMTPQEAQQLLDAQKGEEQFLQFKPAERAERRQRPIKDW